MHVRLGSETFTQLTPRFACEPVWAYRLGNATSVPLGIAFLSQPQQLIQVVKREKPILVFPGKPKRVANL